MHLPAQIITFVEYSKFDISLLADLPFVFGSSPGLYAMTETIEQPLPTQRVGTYVVVQGTKDLTPAERLLRQENGIPTTAPNLCMVPVDTIYEPIAAIPHQGGNPGEFMFIRPCENWGYGFSQMIEEQEPYEDEGDEGTEIDSQTDDSDGSVEGVIVDTESETEDSDGSFSEIGV